MTNAAIRAEVRAPHLPRKQAMLLAATEYQRFADALGSLAPEDWGRPTACPDWDVRAVAAHCLGMAEMAASVRENRRQTKRAAERGGVFIDALTAVQVEERQGMAPEDITARFAKRGPAAARGRRMAPFFVRRRTMPMAQDVQGRPEEWTFGYLIDTVLTRDPWMHRLDIARATNRQPVLSAEHDGRIVDGVVREWAARHGRPYTLTLSGPAGGSWQEGTAGASVEMDAIEFCWQLAGRGTGDAPFGTQVPF